MNAAVRLWVSLLDLARTSGHTTSRRPGRRRSDPGQGEHNTPGLWLEVCGVCAAAEAETPGRHRAPR